MTKILKYKLRRLLFNRFFIGLLLINGVFAWYTLTTDTIAGVAHTAPFSPWSFGAYLSTVMPLLMITILFLLTFFYSKREAQVRTLTAATPVSTVQYMLIRSLAVVLGFLLLLALVVGMAFYFYAEYFGYRHFAVFLVPALLTILPALAFMLGAGHFLGRMHAGWLYALMLVSFAMLFLRIPGEFDLFGAGYYASMPLSLPVGLDGEPAFFVSTPFLVARLGYLVLGIDLFVASLRPIKTRPA